ncbi:MAG: hypothetical protein ACXVKA_09960, partial [Acidimicrobiia bacterium]
EAGEEVLDDRSRVEEALLLALRTRGGVAVEPRIAAAAGELEAEGLVTRPGGRLRLTRRGRLLGSAVTVRLLSALADASAPPVQVAVGRLDC